MAKPDEKEVTQVEEATRGLSPQAVVAGLRRTHPDVEWPGPQLPAKRVEIAPEEVEKVSRLNLTIREAADFFGVSEATMKRRLREPVYRAAWSQGQSTMKRALRRKQIERAMGGSDTMLIWLGKQVLDQTDKPTVEIAIQGEQAEVTVTVSDFQKELADLKQELLAAEVEAGEYDGGDDIPDDADGDGADSSGG